MASRDLTSIFIERRNTSNLRLRTGGAKASKTGSMKPFHISSGDGGDHDLLIEVREVLGDVMDCVVRSLGRGRGCFS